MITLHKMRAANKKYEIAYKNFDELTFKLPNGALKDSDVSYNFTYEPDEEEGYSNLGLNCGDKTLSLTEEELKELSGICKKFYGWK